MFERGNRVVVTSKINYIIYRTGEEVKIYVFKIGTRGTVVSPGFDGQYMVRFDSLGYKDDSNEVWYVSGTQLKLDCLDKSRGKFTGLN